MRLILFILISIFSVELYADNERRCRHTATTLRCLEYIKNYDGDTVTVNVPNVHPIIGQEISIRLLGIDTPELKTKDECEKRIAILARDYLQARILRARPNRIELRNIQRDKYFRLLGELWVNGRNISQALLKNKLAVEYMGGSKAEVDWCAIESEVPAYLIKD